MNKANFHDSKVNQDGEKLLSDIGEEAAVI